MSQVKRVQAKNRLVIATEPGAGTGLQHPDQAAQQLEQHLSQAIGVEVHILLGSNYDEILAGMESEEIDAACLGPYAFALAQNRARVRALVNSIPIVPTNDARSAVPYRSLIITRADSTITYISQLKGQKFAFVDPHSASGYLVPTFLLQRAGLEIADLEATFLFGHYAVAAAVADGSVVAGAIAEEELLRFKESNTDSTFRLLATSSLLARGPVAVRPGLPGPLERRLQIALEQLHLAKLDSAQLLKLPQQRFVAATQRETTLKTIAELAGVSYATVSRAINGRDRIAPATTERILKLVEELGYRPNASARSLHKERGDIIALLLPTTQYPQMDEILEGIQDTLARVEMQLLILHVGQANNTTRLSSYNQFLSNSSIAGILLTHWSIIHPASQELIRSGRSFALLEQDVLETGLSVAYQELQGQGYQHISLLLGQTSLCEPTLTLHTIERLPDIHFLWSELIEDESSWVHTLAQRPELPSAFLCTNDEVALRVRHQLRARDYKQLVVGLGNTPLAQWNNLPSLSYDGYTLGRVAVERLLRMLNISLDIEKGEEIRELTFTLPLIANLIESMS